MTKIILLVGPPGCGKSIWASLYLKDHKAKILSRDALRLAMQGGEYNARDERVIKRVRDYAVENWFRQDYNVVIDDMNLTPDVFPRMITIANRVGDVEVKEHVIQIKQNVCRDNNTHRSLGVVPEEDWNVWWLKYTQHKRHDDYYAPSKMFPLELHYRELEATKLNKAIILDVDNTIAMHPHDRSPHDHTRATRDVPNTAVTK